MKITQTPNPTPTQRSLPKPPAAQVPRDRFQARVFDYEQNQLGYARIASYMAKGAGAGAVAGAATGLMGALPGVPIGLATGLTASAGLITGAWLGLAIGYVAC